MRRETDVVTLAMLDICEIDLENIAPSFTDLLTPSTEIKLGTGHRNSTKCIL